MTKLTEKEIKDINADAANQWGGNVRIAVAAFVFGAHIVRKFNSQIPHYATSEQKREISNFKSQITRAGKKSAKS